MAYIEHQAARNKDVRTPLHQVGILRRFFGADRDFSTITGDDWSRFVSSRLADGVSHATLNRHRATMSKMSALAIGSGYHPGPNPAKALPQFKESKGRYAYLTEQQVSRLVAHARPIYQPYIYLAVVTMARRQEMLRARVEDARLGSPAFLEVRPENAKNGERRMIPLPTMAALILRTLCKGKRPGDLIFSGRGFGLKALHRNFKRAALAAGFPSLRLHDLRHVGASLATERGIDERRLMEIMGHHDSKTCRRYAHLSPRHVADAVRFMESSHFDRGESE